MIPKDNTLVLMKNTVTSGTGGDQSIATSTVQSLMGSLQPATSKEINKYGKETAVVDSVFFVDQAEFTSTANEAQLKASNYMTQASPAKTLDIIGVEDEYVIAGKFYKVILQERK